MNAVEWAEHQKSLLPAIGEAWTRDGKTFRTVGKHRFNEWGQCWHVHFCETREGEIGVRWVSLRQWLNWAHTAKRACMVCQIVTGSEHFTDPQGSKSTCDACKRHVRRDWREAAYEAARNEGTP